jgi:hypothetical protein
MLPPRHPPWLFQRLSADSAHAGRFLEMQGTSSCLMAGRETHLRWLVVIAATAFCVAIVWLMEGKYEEQYSSQFNQGLAELTIRWNSFSLDLHANPLTGFGINVGNSQLWPAFMIADFFGRDIRIPIEAMIQCLMMLLMSAALIRMSGASLSAAFAIGAIAMAYCWIPFLSGNRMTELAVSGLAIQDGAIAVLFALFFFARIGLQKHSISIWPPLGLATTTAWLLLAIPSLAPIFVLTTAFVCIGVICAVENRKEFLEKAAFSAAIAVVFLLLGARGYVFNIMEYTPQVLYRTVSANYFAPLSFKNETLLAAAIHAGNVKVLIFFGLAAIGAVTALRLGNPFARRVVFAGISLEILTHALSALNIAFQILPMTFLYVELLGLPIVAIIAGTGAWTVLRVACLGIVMALAATRILSHHETMQTVRALLPVVLLVMGMVAVLHQVTLLARASSENHWPPNTASNPAQIQIEALGLKPGDAFKGRSITLLRMSAENFANWDVHFYPHLVLKYRKHLGYEFTNDAVAMGVPVANEFSHWTSPPMLALMAAAFYNSKDVIGRVAQAPRAFRPNLARLLGVALVVSDAPIPGETKLYEGAVADYPIFIHRVAGTNVGQFSPTKTVLASGAAAILDRLQAPGFDGRQVAIVEDEITQELASATQVAVLLEKGPTIRVSGRSPGTSMIVLPFDFSHCLRADGQGLQRLVPVNLSQVGVIVRGDFSIEIGYYYGLLSGTSCRKKDLMRVKSMDLENAATGRLFLDTRPK